MSDDAWRATTLAFVKGDISATSVLERGLRAGVFTEAQVYLAAYVGHEPARGALGDLVETVEEGRVCCCGSGDSDHGLYSGHGFRHACDYYDVTCDCVVVARVVRQDRQWPLTEPLSYWAKLVSDTLRRHLPKHVSLDHQAWYARLVSFMHYDTHRTAERRGYQQELAGTIAQWLLSTPFQET